MKLVLFSGTHPRHLFVNQKVLKYFDEVLVIIMQREHLFPKPPININENDKKLFIRHFKAREAVENSIYGKLIPKEVFNGHKTLYVTPKELNSIETASTVKKFEANFCFIFGVNLILDPVIGNLPSNKVNLHLGLSPWYKGGATLYHPFYHLQPQFCGTTFHQITKQADAGEIIHQCIPVLERGDKIHDVAAKCVLKSVDDLPKLINHWLTEKKFYGKIQQTSGRNWRDLDFHPSQLRVVYDLFNDDIVDRYLDGELDQRLPMIFSCLK